MGEGYGRWRRVWRREEEEKEEEEVSLLGREERKEIIPDTTFSGSQRLFLVEAESIHPKPPSESLEGSISSVSLHLMYSL